MDKQNVIATLETRNLGNGLIAQLERNTISLVVSGGRNTINEITAKGLKCYVDLRGLGDRKSTRLNSSHANISYAVFCLKKKKRKLSCNTSYIHPSETNVKPIPLVTLTLGFISTTSLLFIFSVR